MMSTSVNSGRSDRTVMEFGMNISMPRGEVAESSPITAGVGRHLARKNQKLSVIVRINVPLAVTDWFMDGKCPSPHTDPGRGLCRASGLFSSHNTMSHREFLEGPNTTLCAPSG